MMNDNIEILRYFIRGELKDISDVEWLTTIWVKNPGSGPDIVEVTLKFLEACKPIINSYTKYKISIDEFELLSNLYGKVEDYNEYEDSRASIFKTGEAILDDPNWIEITEIAKKAYDCLSKKTEGTTSA